MYKVDINLEERKRQLKEFFDAGFINAGLYVSMLEDIKNEEQTEVLEYHVTDKEMAEYWS